MSQHAKEPVKRPALADSIKSLEVERMPHPCTEDGMPIADDGSFASFVHMTMRRNEIDQAKAALGRYGACTPENLRGFCEQVEDLRLGLQEDAKKLAPHEGRAGESLDDKWRDLNEDLFEWVTRVEYLRNLVKTAKQYEIVDEECAKDWTRSLNAIKRRIAQTDTIARRHDFTTRALNSLASYGERIESITDGLHGAAQAALDARDGLLKNIAHANVEALEEAVEGLKAEYRAAKPALSIDMAAAGVQEFRDHVRQLRAAYGEEVIDELVALQLLEPFSLPEVKAILPFLGAGLPLSKFQELADEMPEGVLVRRRLGNLLMEDYQIDGELAEAVVAELWGAKQEQSESHISYVVNEIGKLLGEGNEGLLLSREPSLIIDAQLLLRARARHALVQQASSRHSEGNLFARGFFTAHPQTLVNDDEAAFKDVLNLLSEILPAHSALRSQQTEALPDLSAYYTTDTDALRQMLEQLRG